MQEIKVIIFDLGNVIIGFDHHIAAKKALRYTDKSEEEIYQLFFDSDLTDLFERGKLNPHEFFLRIKKLLNLNLDYKTFVPIWNEIFFEKEEVSKLVRQLKRKYKLLMISNVNELHFDYVREKFPILNEFEKFILSYEIGARKPEPAIYEAAIKIAGVLPNEIVYTDDRLDLVEGARPLGINAIHFKDVNYLAGELEALGVNKLSQNQVF